MGSWLALAAGGGEVTGPVGVVGLVEEERFEQAHELAEAVHRALGASGKVELLEPERMIQRLGRGYSEDADASGLERLEGLFQQGYLQTYSFEYRRATATLNRVLEGLGRLPPSAGRWDLFVRANIFLGIAQAGMNDRDAALRAFAAVLRTRPAMELSRKEYSPKTIALFEKARRRLAALPRGRLAVESEPAGAKVYLDGVEMDTTPYIGEVFHGRYHLRAAHPAVGAAARWVDIGQTVARVRFQLSFEGAMELSGKHPLIRLPPGARTLPAEWWSWLGARLGIRHLVAVSCSGERLAAALIDLERARKVRQGWLDRRGTSAADLEVDAGELARFMITGRARERLQVVSLEQAAADPYALPAGPLVPPLPVLYQPRPWYRSWWPYALAGAAVLAGTVGAHLGSQACDRRSDQALTASDIEHYRELGDAWRGVAIGGYTLAGVLVLAGIYLDATFAPEEIYLPAPGAGGTALLFAF